MQQHLRAVFFLCLLVLAAHIAEGADCVHGGHSLRAGESYKPADRCVQYTCDAPGRISGKTCPSVATLKPCKLVEDLTKPYPECCATFDC